MTVRGLRARGDGVGFFGRLGSGNYGNDGSFEAVLNFLRADHAWLDIDAMCSGPAVVRERYGIKAEDMHWDRGAHWATGVKVVDRTSTACRVLIGIVVDAVRTARWTRGHALVVVPGMGTFESTLPVRPWQMPWSLFVLAVAGRALGVTTAFVCVGANRTEDRTTRYLLSSALRWASYRSFRDDYSRRAAADMGVDTTRDRVYPDLAFSLPAPMRSTATEGSVGIGVIDWQGSGRDRPSSAALHQRYVGTMAEVVGALVDAGHTVSLFAGDEGDADTARLVECLVRGSRPALAAERLGYIPVSSLGEVMEHFTNLAVLMGSRFHNVLGALRCGVPVVSVGYGLKHHILLKRFGLMRFSHDIRTVDAREILASVGQVLADRERLAAHIARIAAEENTKVSAQFAALTVLLPEDSARLSGTSDLARLSGTGD